MHNDGEQQQNLFASVARNVIDSDLTIDQKVSAMVKHLQDAASHSHLIEEVEKLEIEDCRDFYHNFCGCFSDAVNKSDVISLLKRKERV